MRLFNRRAKLSLLSNFPRLSSKAVFVVILIAFLMDYQPSLGIPPIKKNVARAQTEQVQSVNAEALPFEFSLPHPGYITTRFSLYHPGIDIATGLGMPIKPVAPGTVIDEGYNFWGLGLTVTIDHGFDFKSLYAHLGTIYVQKNQTVDQNNIIGIVGLTGHTTGPHTHLELSKAGKNIDPEKILPQISQMPSLDYIKPVSQKNVPAEEPKTIDFKKEILSSL